MYKIKNEKLDNILNEIERLKSVKNSTPSRAEAVNKLKLSAVKFVREYDLVGSHIYSYLSFQISQL